MAVLDPVTAGYLAGWKLVGRLPESVTGRVFARGADWASGNGAGPEMLRRNLTRVVGPERVTRELVRDAMRSYACYWHEAFRLPQLAGHVPVPGVGQGEDHAVTLVKRSVDKRPPLHACIELGEQPGLAGKLRQAERLVPIARVGTHRIAYELSLIHI